MISEYDIISGIGIEFTQEMIANCIEKNFFKEDDDLYECFKFLGFEAEQAGNAYCGELYWYIMIPGENLTEILENEASFIMSLKKLNIDVTRHDLKVISDRLIY